jgi:hypothetical protein
MCPPLAVAAMLVSACHSSFQPFPDALACAGATVRSVGLDADSAGITQLSTLNDVVWYAWRNGTKRSYVTYHNSATADSLPAEGTPKGINSSGIVVLQTPTGALLYDHGSITRITPPASWSVLAPTPFSGSSAWAPIGITDSGVVALAATATPTRDVVLLWRAGSATTGLSWPTASTTLAINNANVVLTQRASGAPSAGSLYELHAPTGTTRTFDGAVSFAYNDVGDVAFGRLTGGTTSGTLQTLSGSTLSLTFAPTGLNNTQQMIGMSAGVPVYARGTSVLRIDHALDDLNLVITAAVALNNNGTIAANAISGTVKHPVGLTFNASACTLK